MIIDAICQVKFFKILHCSDPYFQVEKHYWAIVEMQTVNDALFSWVNL